jgi:hypothetical protein
MIQERLRQRNLSGFVKRLPRITRLAKIDLLAMPPKVYFAIPELKPDSVAQLVEQLTLNQWVESSNLSGVTIFI